MKLMKYLQVNPLDYNLPRMICKDCINQIQSAYSLKLKCLETDQLLRQLSIDERSTSANIQDIHNNEGIEGSSKEIIQAEDYLEDEQPVVCERRTYKKRKVPIARDKNKKPDQHDYRCFICEQVFDLISAKDHHVKKDHTAAKVCRVCNKRKQTPISLETHLRCHLIGYRFLCSSCGKCFRYKNLLENHLKVEHYNEVKFACDLCKYETKFKINLERHVKSVHMKIKNFKCHHCSDHEYTTQVGLNLHHYRVHNFPAPITCPDCRQGFTFESELRVHKKHCTGSTIRTAKARPQDAAVDILENGFRCRVCLQIFDTRSKWSVHYHHKHKNSNVCTICNKQMASSTSLFKHVQVENEISIVGRLFKRSLQVQHNNIKKFQCDICSKTFGFKHSLESHKNTHTGEVTKAL